MYKVSNLKPKQLAYIKSTLLKKYGIGLNGINVSGEMLIMTRNIDKSHSDTVMVTEANHHYYAAYYPSDQSFVEPTDISVFPTIMDATVDQFRQINANRMDNTPLTV